MNRLPSSFDGLQITLLALLPKDGTPMTVHQLAKATGAKEFEVTNALFGPYMAHEVNFDVRADAYSAPRKGNDLPTDLPTERKTT